MTTQAIQDDCKQIINGLINLTNEELSCIVDDEEKISNLLTSLDQCYVKNLEAEKEVIIASINELGESNLTKEPELVEGREIVERLSQEGEDLTKIIEEKYKQLKNKGGDMNLETALALLQTAASEMEEETDKVAKQFLDNNTELDSFLDEFLIKRKLMHLRLVKAEKLSKILSRDVFQGTAGNYINAPPVSLNSSYYPSYPTPALHPGTVPYPTGAMNMPMPPLPTQNYFQNHY